MFGHVRWQAAHDSLGCRDCLPSHYYTLHSSSLGEKPIFAASKLVITSGTEERECVLQGNECGVVLEGFSGFQPGDTLQCIKTKLVPQSIENVCTVLHTGKAQLRNQKYNHAT